MIIFICYVCEPYICLEPPYSAERTGSKIDLKKSPLNQTLFVDEMRHLNTDSDSEILLNILAQELQRMFEKLEQGFVNQTLHATHDDALVFEKILDAGIASLPVWETGQHGPWRLLNNPMRALRPPRASLEIVDSVHRLFDETRFNFNKPFLRPEILWQGAWRGTSLRVLYNKFPFVPYHTIIVPEPGDKHLKDANGLIDTDYLRSRNRFDRIQYRLLLATRT